MRGWRGGGCGRGGLGARAGSDLFADEVAAGRRRLAQYCRCTASGGRWRFGACGVPVDISAASGEDGVDGGEDGGGGGGEDGGGGGVDGSSEDDGGDADSEGGGRGDSVARGVASAGVGGTASAGRVGSSGTEAAAGWRRPIPRRSGRRPVVEL